MSIRSMSSNETPGSLPPQHSGPDGPTETGQGGWKATLQRTSKKIVVDRVSISAGSLAYHWFLALFPSIIALLGFLALFHVGRHLVTHLTHALNTALPKGVAGVFTAAVSAATGRHSGSTVAIIIGIAVAIWSASGGMSALQQALDIAYEIPRDRTFIARRIRALPMMLATFVLGGSGAALVIFGAPIAGAIQGHVPLHGIAFSIVWTIVRWGAALIVISALLSIYYFLGTNREAPRWQWVTAGGVLATIIFLVASLAFSFYVTKFGSYGKTYGTFAGVAILIFWFYLTGFAVLLGAELNSELEREAAAQSGDRGAQRRAATIERTTAADQRATA